MLVCSVVVCMLTLLSLTVRGTGNPDNTNNCVTGPLRAMMNKILFELTQEELLPSSEWACQGWGQHLHCSHVVRQNVHISIGSLCTGSCCYRYLGLELGLVTCNYMNALEEHIVLFIIYYLRNQWTIIQYGLLIPSGTRWGAPNSQQSPRQPTLVKLASSLLGTYCEGSSPVTVSVVKTAFN